METFTETFDGATGASLRQDIRTWTQRPCGPGENCWWSSPNVAIDHNPRVCQKFTVLTDASPAQSAAVLYQYDRFNNLTDTYEYDF